MKKEEILQKFIEWIGEQDDELYFEITPLFEEYIEKEGK